MRAIAWVLIGFAILTALVAIIGLFSAFDLRGFGSLVFVAFFLAAAGWIVGDF